MKCEACKYENRNGEWDADKLEIVEEDEDKDPFIRISGNFTYQPYSYSQNIRPIRLFACPVCGVVKVDRSNI